MMHASQQRKAGVGMAAVGALVLGSAFGLSCQPGDLPCDQSSEWRTLCDQAAGGTGGTAAPTPPATGGTGGSVAMPPAPGVVSAATAVMGCAQFDTVGKMDAFFAMRCGVSNLCHGAGTAWTSMPAQNAFEKFKTAKAAVSCSGGPLANAANWRESVLWTKTQTPAGCPPGSSSPGLTMPPQMTFEPKMAVLTAPEMACLEGYLKAITGN